MLDHYIMRDLSQLNFCHHHNVSEEDIDMISDAIEYVASNLKKKE